MEVKRFTFDDWEDGKVQGDIEPGKKLVTDIDTGESWYEEIPIDLCNEIKAAQKNIRGERVGGSFKSMKDSFEEKFNQSPSKKTLLKGEINYIKYLFGLKKKVDLNRFPQINNTMLSWFRSLFPKIESNENEFHLTNPNDTLKDSWYVRVKASILYLEWLKKLQNPKSTDHAENETKYEKLKSAITVFGFSKLNKVKALQESNQVKLIELISDNELPYQIAMLDYLGFIYHIQKNFIEGTKKMQREISRILGSDTDGRSVRGNISALVKKPQDKKPRYTAHLHKETVEKDYQNLN